MAALVDRSEVVVSVKLLGAADHGRASCTTSASHARKAEIETAMRLVVGTIDCTGDCCQTQSLLRTAAFKDAADLGHRESEGIVLLGVSMSSKPRLLIQ